MIWKNRSVFVKEQMFNARIDDNVIAAGEVRLKSYSETTYSSYVVDSS
jgi:hypothetical protein